MYSVAKCFKLGVRLSRWSLSCVCGPRRGCGCARFGDGGRRVGPGGIGRDRGAGNGGRHRNGGCIRRCARPGRLRCVSGGAGVRWPWRWGRQACLRFGRSVMGRKRASNRRRGSGTRCGARGGRFAPHCKAANGLPLKANENLHFIIAWQPGRWVGSPFDNILAACTASPGRSLIINQCTITIPNCAPLRIKCHIITLIPCYNPLDGVLKNSIYFNGIKGIGIKIASKAK